MRKNKAIRSMVIIMVGLIILLLFGGCKKEIASTSPKETQTQINTEPSSSPKNTSIPPASTKTPTKVSLEPPMAGLYQGTTSQGYDLLLWVAEIDGKLIISAVQHKIKMRGSEYSVTIEMFQPADRNFPVENASFDGIHTDVDTIEILKGSFYGSDVRGTLTCTHTHPQGLGTASSSVSFTAHFVQEQAIVTETAITEEEPLSVNIQPRHYIGTTDQGFSIELWIEEINGDYFISAVQYKIKMIGTEYSVTSEMMMPFECSFPIIDNDFEGTRDSQNEVDMISGTIAEGLIRGALICIHTHPQGIGTATAQVNFTAYLED